MTTTIRSTENGTASEPEPEHDHFDPRDAKALTQYLTVLDDVGLARDAPDIYTVVSQSSKTYTVDAREGVCTCADFEYRSPRGGCKHVRRVAFATGVREIPDWIDSAKIDPDLGRHVDDHHAVAERNAHTSEHTQAQAPAVATDGGTGQLIEAGDDGVILNEDDATEEEEHDVFTYHVEPIEQGGKEYARCTGCFREILTSIGEDKLGHAEGCSHADIIETEVV